VGYILELGGSASVTFVAGQKSYKKKRDEKPGAAIGFKRLDGGAA